MMTRKHYIKFAKMLSDSRHEATARERYIVDKMTISMADMFANDNPNFNRQRFYDAAGYCE